MNSIFAISLYFKEEQTELARAEQESRLKKFMEKEGTIVSKPLDPFHKKDTGS